MTLTSIELFKAWYLFSFSLGCWTCLNLLFNSNGDNKIKRSLLLFIILLLAPPISAYLQLITPSNAYWINTISINLTLAYGPILLTIINHVLLRKTKPLNNFLHWLPFILLMLSIITNTHENLLSIPFLLFSIIFIQVFTYISYAAFVLLAHKKRLSAVAKQHKNTTYYWLLFLIVGLFIIMIIDVSVWLFAQNNIYANFILLSSVASAVAIYIHCIALFSLYQPAIFFQTVIKNEELEQPAETKLRNVELSPEAANQLSLQLNELVKIHKPHLDEDISLAKLSALLGVTRNQLSELLNIHKNITFYDFLNDLRYQESLSLLEDNKIKLTIADIAYRAGFNNKNSFYNVFKLKTGLTPSEYKKRKTA